MKLNKEQLIEYLQQGEFFVLEENIMYNSKSITTVTTAIIKRTGKTLEIKVTEGELLLCPITHSDLNDC